MVYKGYIRVPPIKGPWFCWGFLQLRAHNKGACNYPQKAYPEEFAGLLREGRQVAGTPEGFRVSGLGFRV